MDFDAFPETGAGKENGPDRRIGHLGFLTKKELAKYLGMSAATISNQISSGTFPIRVKRMGRSVRFDMREILDYLENNKPFWERDKEQKEAKR
jgi:excisionase family DNA binding protein